VINKMTVKILEKKKITFHSDAKQERSKGKIIEDRCLM
jgi:hypothetical protein